MAMTPVSWHIAAMVERISRNGEKRESVMARAELWREGATDATVHRVRNVSPSGACVDHGGELRLGARLTMDIGHETRVPAIVAWARRDAAGLRFGRPISTCAAVRRCEPQPVLPTYTAGWLDYMPDAYRAA
jgi:hypothetical protein